MARRKRVRNYLNGNKKVHKQYFTFSGKSCGFEPICYDEEDDYLTLEYLERHLPNLQYIVTSLINFILAIDWNEKVEKFLDSTNVIGTTNRNELFKAMYDMFIYGKSGLHFIDEERGMVFIKHDLYTPNYINDRSLKYLKKVNGYKISTDNVHEDVKEWEFTEDLDNWLVSDKKTLVPNEYFIELMHVTGRSPLLSDRLQLQFFVEVANLMIYALKDEGFGRIFLKQQDTLFQSEGVSDSELLSFANSDKGTFADYKENVEKSVKNIAEKGIDSVSVFPQGLSIDKVIQKQLKITEFSDLFSLSDAKISQLYGMIATVLGLGHQSGNVSMAAIIKYAERMFIKPQRDAMFVPFMKKLATLLGLGEDEELFIVSKDKYDEAMGKYINSVSQGVSAITKQGFKDEGKQMLEKFIFMEEEINE